MSFASQIHLDRHIDEQHTAPKYKCNQCNKIFKRETSYKSHLQTHNPSKIENYQCYQCRRLFAHDITLYNHLRNDHIKNNTDNSNTDSNNNNNKKKKKTYESKKPEPCSVCGKVFVSYHSPKFHSRLHINGLPFKCNRCIRRFKTINECEEHKAKCKNYSYKCFDCLNYFMNSSILILHLESRHGIKIKRHTCPYPNCHFTGDTLYEIQCHTDRRTHINTI